VSVDESETVVLLGRSDSREIWAICFRRRGRDRCARLRLLDVCTFPAFNADGSEFLTIVRAGSGEGLEAAIRCRSIAQRLVITIAFPDGVCIRSSSS
jgi:hypothetical protein